MLPSIGQRRITVMPNKSAVSHTIPQCWTSKPTLQITSPIDYVNHVRPAYSGPREQEDPREQAVWIFGSEVDHEAERYERVRSDWPSQLPDS